MRVLALALRGDTVPFELIKLGGLFLGAGELDYAVALTHAALAGHDTSAPHHVTANVLLASGQIFRALEIVSTPSSNWFIADPVADSLISFGGVEPIFDRLRILGTVGLSGPVLETELDKIGRLWSEPQYSARQVDLLRRYAALRVSIGLAFDHAALSSWLGDSDVASALWNALLNSESDLTGARAHLEASLDTTILGLSESSRSFLHGLVAQRTGDFRLAVSQFSRIDSLPLSLEVFRYGVGSPRPLLPAASRSVRRAGRFWVGSGFLRATNPRVGERRRTQFLSRSRTPGPQAVSIA